jgi:DNA-directed RNA polymerase-5 subunit 1
MFIHLDTTNGKLLVVPCVQFSFSDDHTVLSVSVEGSVNVIVDSVGFIFLSNVT